MNDIVIIYALVTFSFMLIKWYVFGFSQRMNITFRRYEKWFWENRAEYLTDSQLRHRKIGLLIAHIFLIIFSPCMWIYTFGISDGGNAPKMQSTLQQSSFIIYIYMVISYMINLFVMIFCITGMEMRKYVL